MTTADALQTVMQTLEFILRDKSHSQKNSEYHLEHN